MGDPAPSDALRVSYGSVATQRPPTARRRCVDRCCAPTDGAVLCRDIVFLVVQGVLACVVGVGLLALVLLCAALVPCCGLGVVLFRLLFRLGLVEFAATCDAALVNYVADARAQIQIDAQRAVLPLVAPAAEEGEEEEEEDGSGQPTERLVSGLRRVTTESAMVLVHLTTLKLVLATLGLCAVALVVTMPVLLIHLLLTNQNVFGSAASSGWEVACSAAVVLLVFGVAVMSVALVVRLSAAATRGFCCERVYALSLPRPWAASSVSRPNVVVIRLPPSAAHCSSTSVFSLGSTSMVLSTSS